MKTIIDYIKTNFYLIIGTIIIYQLFLVVFFYTSKNLQILGFEIIILAFIVIYKTYKDKFFGIFKKK